MFAAEGDWCTCTASSRAGSCRRLGRGGWGATGRCKMLPVSCYTYSEMMIYCVAVKWSVPGAASSAGFSSSFFSFGGMVVTLLPQPIYEYSLRSARQDVSLFLLLCRGEMTPANADHTAIPGNAYSSDTPQRCYGPSIDLRLLVCWVRGASVAKRRRAMRGMRWWRQPPTPGTCRHTIKAACDKRTGYDSDAL